MVWSAVRGPRGFLSLGRTVRTTARSLFPDVPVAPDDPLARRQLWETQRPARVQLLGGDSDLGAEPELLTVGERGGGVHHHRRRVHSRSELLCGSKIGGDDGLGVT